MPKSRYTTSLEPQRGKATGALGFMEQLTGHLKSVGVFRPVTAEDTDSDRLIALLTGLYHLPFPAEDLCTASRWKRRFHSLLQASTMSCTLASSNDTRLSTAGAILSPVWARIILDNRNCDVLSVIINRVEPARREHVLAALKQGLPGNRPVYVLPEEPLIQLSRILSIAGSGLPGRFY